MILRSQRIADVDPMIERTDTDDTSSTGTTAAVGLQSARPDASAAVSEVTAVSPTPFESELASDLDNIQRLDRLWDEASAGPVATTAPTHRDEADQRPPLEIRDTPGPDGTLGRVGRYILLKKLGKGGFGVVYQARDVSLERLVALKIPLPEVVAATDVRSRFLHEARAAARLDHPHIIPVHDWGAIGDTCFIASAYCSGPSLLVWRRARSLPVPTKLAARLIASVADALEHAHDRGILHLDLKPGNILIQVTSLVDPKTSSVPHAVEWADRADLDPAPRVTDFGLAWIIEEDGDPGRAGSPLGTPPYMAPEQVTGATHTVSAATDVYALGVILYELLTGQPPFLRGDDTQDLLRQIREDEPPAPSLIRRGLPRDLEIIIQKCLEKDPKRRYPTAGELAADLRSFIRGMPIRARPIALPQRAWRWSKRHPARAISGVLACLAVAVLTLALGVWNTTLHSYNARLQAYNTRLTETLTALDHEAARARVNEGLTDRHLRAANIRMAQQNQVAGRLERAQELQRQADAAHAGSGRLDFASRYLRREARRELELAWQHTESIVGMAIAPDGRTLASSDASGILLVGDSRADVPAWKLETHTNGARILAFNPNGHTLFASGDHATGVSRAQLVDAASGTLRGRFPHMHDRRIRSAKFLAGGTMLALASTRPDGTDPDLRVFACVGDHSDPTPILTIRTENLVDLAPQSERIALIKQSGELALFDATTGEIATTACAASGIEAPVCSPSGRFVAGFRGNEVVLWDREAPTPSEVVSLDAQVVGLQFLHDQRILLATTTLGRVHLIDIHSRQQRIIRPDGFEMERSLCLAARGDGGVIATNTYGHPGGSSQLSLWNTDTGALVATCPGRGGMPNKLAFSPDGHTLYIARGRWISRWKLDIGHETVQLPVHTDEAWSATFSPDGLTLVTTSDDTDDPQTVKFWKFQPDSPEQPLRLRLGWHAHSGTVSDSAFSPDGKTVATVSLEPKNSVKLWDVATGRLLARLLGHTDWVRAVEFSPNGTLLATAGNDATVRIWDVATGHCLHELRAHQGKIRSLAFSPDGSEIASAGNDQYIFIWDVHAGTMRRALHAMESIVAIEYSPSGSLLAAADASGLVSILDAKTRQTLRRLSAEVDELICLTFSSTDDVLATAGISGTIHLWDPLTGQELLTFEGHAAQVNSLAFNQDDTVLVSCDHVGVLRIWRADP